MIELAPVQIAMLTGLLSTIGMLFYFAYIVVTHEPDLKKNKVIKITFLDDELVDVQETN